MTPNNQADLIQFMEKLRDSADEIIEGSPVMAHLVNWKVQYLFGMAYAFKLVGDMSAKKYVDYHIESINDNLSKALRDEEDRLLMRQKE